MCATDPWLRAFVYRLASFVNMRRPAATNQHTQRNDDATSSDCLYEQQKRECRKRHHAHALSQDVQMPPLR
uniref:Uncharacterized protein n=1 Tax=Acrobeloides nanus TaxID=290746 RepID=A0A914BW55_9BILA